MANFRQTTDNFIKELKALAAGDADKLHDFCVAAAGRLAARAQKIEQAKTLDLAKFIGEMPGDAAGKAAFESYRSARQAERDVAGDPEE